MKMNSLSLTAQDKDSYSHPVFAQQRIDFSVKWQKKLGWMLRLHLVAYNSNVNSSLARSKYNFIRKSWYWVSFSRRNRLVVPKENNLRTFWDIFLKIVFKTGIFPCKGQYSECLGERITMPLFYQSLILYLISEWDLKNIWIYCSTS